MTEKKIVRRFFSIVEYVQEGEWLTEMARKGYRLVSVSGIGKYTFEEAEPEEVVYQLDFNQDGIRNKAEYIQMFRDCGWEYLFDYFGYSYFRKAAAEMEGEESIFCDEESRKDMIRRVYHGKILPLLCLFLVLVVPQTVMWAYRMHEGTLEMAMFVCYVIMFAVYAFILCSFGGKYFRYMNDGERR